MSKLKSFRPQTSNANRHTERGMALLSKSVSRDGIADGITVAADGESISGAARLETLADIMPDVKIVVVDTDGKTLLVNRRTDIPNANDERAVRLGVASNAVSSSNWNPDGALLAAMAADDEAIAQMVKNDDRAAKAVLEQSVEFKEFDESVADGVSVCKCPACGHSHAKKD